MHQLIDIRIRSLGVATRHHVLHRISEKNNPFTFLTQHLEISTDLNEIFRQYSWRNAESMYLKIIFFREIFFVSIAM